MAVDHIVPTFKGYTDVDVYGRGSDNVFGKGAEAQNALEAKRILAATRFAKANIRPQDVIDYDLYGRGDPRVFGKGSETINKLEAEKQLKENQSKNKYRLRGLMFKSHAIELVKVGMGRLRKVPSIRAARRDESNSEEIETQPATVQEGNAPNVAKQWSTSSPASTPKRVTSRLPSEEVRPAVEAGAVLRAIKSYSEDDDLRSALPDDQASDDMEVAIDLEEDDAGPSTNIALAIDPRALTKEGSRIGDIKYNKNDRGVVVPKLSTASSRSVFEPKEMNALVPPEEGAFDAAVSSEEKAVEMSSSEQDEEMESTSGESEHSSSVIEEETSSEDVGAHEEVSGTYEDEDETVALRRSQTSDQSASEEEELESSTSEEQENSSDDIEVTSEDEEMEDVNDEDGKRSASYEGSSPQESSSDVETTETELGANALPSKGLGDIQNATSPTTPARQEVEEFPNEESRVERSKSIADRMALFENEATHTEPKMAPSNDSVSAPAYFSRTRDGLQERNMPSSQSRQDIVASDSNYSGPGVLEDDAFVTENMVLDEEELTRKISYHEVESTQIIPIAREKSVTFATNQNQVEDEAVDARGTDQSTASASEENTGFWGRLNFFRARSTTSSHSMSREGSGKSDGASEARDSTNAGPLGESLGRNPSIAERIASFASQSGNNAPASSAQLESREPSATQTRTSEDSRTTSDEEISTSDSNVHSADSDEEMEDSEGGFVQSQSSSAVEDLSSEDTSAEGVTSGSEPTVSSSEALVTSSEPSVSSSEPAVSSSEPAIEDSTEPSNAEEDDFVQAT